MSDKRMRPIRLIPIRLIEPWRCTTPPGWREYAAMMRAGDEFPPVQVIRQSSKLHGYPYRLFDGYHRTRAAKHIGRRTIAAHVNMVEKMIDRQHDRIVIECDSCEEVFEGEAGEEFGMVWNAAKRDGWSTRKIAEEWLHGCPRCGAPS